MLDLFTILEKLASLDPQIKRRVVVKYSYQFSKNNVFKEHNFGQQSGDISNALAVFEKYKGQIVCKPFYLKDLIEPGKAERVSHALDMLADNVVPGSMFFVGAGGAGGAGERIRFKELTITLDTLNIDILSAALRQQLVDRDLLDKFTRFALYQNAPKTVSDLVADPGINVIDKINYLLEANRCAYEFVEGLSKCGLYHFGISPSAIRCWKDMTTYKWMFAVGNYSEVDSSYLERESSEECYVSPRMWAQNALKMKSVKSKFKSVTLLTGEHQADQVFQAVFANPENINSDKIHKLDNGKFQISTELALHQSIFAINMTFYELFKEIDGGLARRRATVQAKAWTPYLSRITYFFDLLDMRHSTASRIRSCINEMEIKRMPTDACYTESNMRANVRSDADKLWAVVTLFIYLRFECTHLAKPEFVTAFGGEHLVIDAIDGIEADALTASLDTNRIPIDVALLKGLLLSAGIDGKHRDELSPLVVALKEMAGTPAARTHKSEMAATAVAAPLALAPANVRPEVIAKPKPKPHYNGQTIIMKSDGRRLEVIVDASNKKYIYDKVAGKSTYLVDLDGSFKYAK
jgi:hypothetical protein